MLFISIYALFMHGTNTHSNMILMHGTNTHRAFRVEGFTVGFRVSGFQGFRVSGFQGLGFRGLGV